MFANKGCERRSINVIKTGGLHFLSDRPSFAEALEQLLDNLKVDPIAFSECAVAPGWRMTFAASPTVGLHYVEAGTGQIVVEGALPIPFEAGVVLMTPPGLGYRIEPFGQSPAAPGDRTLEITLPPTPPTSRADRWIAGKGDPSIVLVCGHFVALDPVLEGLFAGLRAAIVHSFAGQSMADLMHMVAGEFDAPRPGQRSMVRALLHQLLISLFREADAAHEPWVDSVRVLRDVQVMRAFHAMVADVAALHSQASLADIACLSRSAFSKRFSEALGDSPMAVLRELRLLRAAELLRIGTKPVQQICSEVGYQSASSLSRAFRARFGAEPMAYRLRCSQRLAQ